MMLFKLIIAITYCSYKVSASMNLSQNETEVFQSDKQEEHFNITRESHQLKIVPIVNCPAGRFRGSVRYTRGGKRYFEFQSIPYAEPPKRFEPAIPKARIEDEYDATTEPPVCPQIPIGDPEFRGQEDCLYLSVSTPYDGHCKKDSSKNGLLPVLFWIHQGAYNEGNGSFYKGAYLLDKCIVLVTINYRLAALGFLTTEDDVIPGNLGLKDQLLALKWTRRNIKYFRGDPHLVTIAGTSAGGSSVGHHICSSGSAGLFSRGISMSGAILNPWSITEKPRINAVNLAKAFLCLDLSSAGIKSCLLRQRAKDIVEKQSAAADFSLRFTPVLEPRNAINPFQTGIPFHLLKTGQINKVPLLTGFVEDEGILFGASVISNFLLSVGLNIAWLAVAPIQLFYDNLNIPRGEMNQITNSIRYFYFNIFPISEKQVQNFMNMLSDRSIVQGIYETVQVISRHVPTYLYLNTYKGGASLAQITSGYKIPVISHLDDEQYLFPKYKLWLPGTEQFEFSKDMLELWTNFMRSGRPFGRATKTITWEKTDFQEPVYRKVFNLDNPMKTIRNLWRRRTKFWRGLGLYNYEFAEYFRVSTSRDIYMANLTSKKLINRIAPCHVAKKLGETECNNSI